MIWNSLFLVLATIATLLPSLDASETDGYTYRKAMLSPDFPALNEALNKITTARMNEAVKSLRDCNHDELERVLDREVGDVHVAGISLMFGVVERDLNEGRSPFFLASNGTQSPLAVIKTPPEEHIYNVFRPVSEKGFITSGRFMTFVAFKFNDKMGQELIIGSDKTAHFFSQGKEYLDHYRTMLRTMAQSTLNVDYVRSYAMDDTLNFGVDTEIRGYGLGIETPAGTGIFSYGDLATNFAGLRFWFQLTPEHETLAPKGFWDSIKLPVDYSTKPYFTCVDSRWKMTRPFEWEDFITPAWDETINANEFLTPLMKEKFMGRIQALHNKDLLPSDQFPLDPKLCRSLKDMAPLEYMRKFVNPLCMELIYGDTAEQAGKQ